MNLNLKPAYSIDELLTIHPAGRSAVYEAIGKGLLVARKIGGRTVILGADYLDYLNALPKVEPHQSVSG